MPRQASPSPRARNPAGARPSRPLSATPTATPSTPADRRPDIRGRRQRVATAEPPAHRRVPAAGPASSDPLLPCSEFCRSAPRPAFTLVELLVSLSIIALLIGILVPTLGIARERARNAVCLSNLRSLGTATRLYLDHESRGVFPDALPLIDPAAAFSPKPDLGFVGAVSPYLDAPPPREDPEDPGYFQTPEVWCCPSDRASADAATGFRPLWRSGGSSYEYSPGYAILALETFFAAGPERARVVTQLWEEWTYRRQEVPFLGDAAPFHARGGARRETDQGLFDAAGPLPGHNALYISDGRAGPMISPGEDSMTRFVSEAARRLGASSETIP